MSEINLLQVINLAISGGGLGLLWKIARRLGEFEADFRGVVEEVNQTKEDRVEFSSRLSALEAKAGVDLVAGPSRERGYRSMGIR